MYDDFVRTKKQCGEPTEGLTFEKFQHTLKKNRDALIQRHGCKRVRFSVYIKDGKAARQSLKLGKELWGQVEAVSGLSGGERVIVKGLEGITEGERVTLKQP